MSAPGPVPPQYYQPRPRSIFGPMVLITLGILFLLHNVHWIPSHALHLWFAHYWPVLLIFWGVVKLVEHLHAQRHGGPTPRLGGGSIVFLVFFILLSSAFTQTVGWNWSGLRSDWDPGDWGFNLTGDRYQFSRNFAQPLDGGTQIKVLCNQGDVSVSASDDGQVHAVVHKTLHAESQDGANRMNENTNVRFTQQGGIWLLDLTGGDYERGRFDLDLQLPRQMALSLATHRGNLTVSQREGNVDVSTDRGNASVEQVKGDASLHLRGGSVTVRNVTGNVQVDGAVDDGSISDVTGTLDFDAGYNGNVQIARVGQRLHFKSVRTDLQVAKLEGEINMGHGDLRASSLSGPVKLTTRSNEVHFEDVSGEVFVENRNDVVELRPKAPLGNIDVSNVNGGIEIQMPESSSFRLDAQSTSGNIDVSDFPVSVDNSRRDSVARGVVGKGGPDVHLRAERGTIQVRKE